MSLSLGVAAVLIALSSLSFSIFAWRRERRDRIRQRREDMLDVAVTVQAVPFANNGYWQLAIAGGTAHSRTRLVGLWCRPTGTSLDRIILDTNLDSSDDSALRPPLPPSAEEGWVDQLVPYGDLMLSPGQVLRIPVFGLGYEWMLDEPRAVWIAWDPGGDAGVHSALHLVVLDPLS